MNYSEYVGFDGLGIAQLISQGEISADEAKACALQGVERFSDLNAVISAAHEQPYDASGPFGGVPFLVKELVLQARGAQCRSGSRAVGESAPAVADSELMARFRKAGLHLVGTTQTPEMGYNATTETVAFGPVHNPWKAGHSAGGSSGGSGAAVAAGIVPVAHANDGGGSIRVPASCNGLVGLKPTRDRVPTGPFTADPLFAHAIELAVTRSVRDAATVLDCVAGADLGAPHMIAPGHGSFADAAAAPPRKVKVAYTDGSLLSGVTLDAENATAARKTMELMAGLGHEIVDCAISLDFEEFAHHINYIWCAFAAQFVEQTSAAMGCAKNTENFEAVTLTCAEVGAATSALQILDALAYVNRISREVAQAFTGFDVLLSSTLATPPPVHGFLNQNDEVISAIDWTRKTFRYANNTPIFNSTGQPAISLPMHWSADGLPVGIQLAGPMGGEGLLLNLATQLEQEAGWQDKLRLLASSRD